MTWKSFHREQKEKVEALLPAYIEKIEDEGPLREAMLYSLEAGGKRLRPFLAILVAHLLEKSPETVYPYACALEFIHTYSLIHDDLPAMDDDDLRRGKPSSHKKFGEDLAILAGDALLTDAFTLLFTMGEGDLKRGGSYLARCAGGKGMVLGQVMDCRIPEKERNVETLDTINLKKTGCLIQAGLAGAAAFLGADKKIVDALEEYGKYIGLAFQIADDILDIVADETLLGKPVGSDAELDKATYPSLLGLEEAKRVAAEYVEKARECLAVLPENGYREMLYDFSSYIIERSY